MKVFWNIAPCSLVEIDRWFRDAYCLHQLPGGGDSKHLWNVGQFLPDYMTQYPRRQSSSRKTVLKDVKNTGFPDEMLAGRLDTIAMVIQPKQNRRRKWTSRYYVFYRLIRLLAHSTFNIICSFHYLYITAFGILCLTLRNNCITFMSFSSVLRLSKQSKRSEREQDVHILQNS
jgi:hypothetical protein